MSREDEKNGVWTCEVLVGGLFAGLGLGSLLGAEYFWIVFGCSLVLVGVLDHIELRLIRGLKQFERKED